ncbi:hypothetical protein [Brytella acorum]|uniref:Uncharacterized protein n=1 Tax=Brytella acorum TaxID=2959299 RepID=A0AA35Y5P6_9PROT|nr:hypothetical protein [Brytella acorum]CAI9122249.1 hypothetical protein LMG32879_003109 [Brytella acorum]
MSKDSATPIYEAEALAALPKFTACLTFCNQALLNIHRQMPREVRYVADVRRWLLTHAALQLHFKRQTDPSSPLLNAANVYRLVEHSGMASPNTVTSYLKEIENFGYIEAIPHDDHRVRAYRMSDFSEKMFHVYLGVNLQALDQMDGAGRKEFIDSTPKILNYMHPVFAQFMLNDEFLYSPPESISLLTSTTTGISILNEMTRSIESLTEKDVDRINIFIDSANAMALRYGTSRANVARLLKKIHNAGDFGKADQGHWISARLLRDYHRWQARKFAHASRAYVAALNSMA